MLWNVIIGAVGIGIAAALVIMSFVRARKFHTQEEREAEQMRMQDHGMQILFKWFKTGKWWPL